MTTHYDLIVIGGGTAGLTAAGFAVRLGLSVLLVEKTRIGGDCTWTGCVPSKALIRAAKAAYEARRAHEFGVHGGSVDVVMSEVRAHIDRSIAEIYHHETPEALRAQGVNVLVGAARFIDPHTITVDGAQYRARRFLLATGARPRTPDLPGLAQVPHDTYETIFANDRLPDHLVVIGAGAIGTEMAQAYARLGARVTLIGAMRLLGADADLVTAAEATLARAGVTRVHADALAVSAVGDSVCVEVEGAESIVGDRLLIAVGRAPTVHGLGLTEAGVTHSDAGILVDPYLRTSARHIYAAGDCTGGHQFTHYAGWQAFQALRNAFLPAPARAVLAHVPWTIFTDPEMAQVGMGEAEARARYGDRVRISRLTMARTDRAIVDGDRHGFIKIIHLPNGKLLGAVVVASRAGEVITEYALGMARGISATGLATAIHTYPTYATAAQLVESAIASDALLGGVTGRVVRWLARRA